MFNHVVFGVSDHVASKSFFLKALEPLGVALVNEGPLGIEMCRPDSNSSLCLRRAEEPNPAHLHLAFVAKNRELLCRLRHRSGWAQHRSRLPGAMPVSRTRYRITTDPREIDAAAAHAFLTRSYWAEGISRELVERAIANSLCFAILDGSDQVAFARVVTDRATFAYLCDVYVLEDHRGRGLGKQLVQAVQAHPDLQALRRFVLVTKDAHALYAAHGFQPLANAAGFMEIVVPDIYTRKKGTT